MQNSNSDIKKSEKVAPVPMSEERKGEIAAQFTDDVLSKLTGAFFDVCATERWTKRDLSRISGMNETAIGHILSGRRKNLKLETIALLARAMQVRPELVLHDTRPSGNHQAGSAKDELWRALRPRGASLASIFDDKPQLLRNAVSPQSSPAMAESAAYGIPDANKAMVR
jgi:DNA-binding Xre family transcriptional regulator